MDERGGNAHEMLSFLAAANKMCTGYPQPKDYPSFGAAFVSLIREHQYDRNIINAFNTAPNDVASFDFRLYTMATHTLFMAAPELAAAMHFVPPPTATTDNTRRKNETDRTKLGRGGKPEPAPTPAPHGGKGSAVNLGRRSVTKADGTCPVGINLTSAECGRVRANIKTSINRYWSSGTAAEGLNGQTSKILLMDVVQQLVTADTTSALTDPEWQLRRFPLDLVDWPTLNSDRRDIVLDNDFLLCCNQSVITAGVLPADEAISAGSSDFLTEGSGMSVDGASSGGGHQLFGPNPWLLSYWLARYYKLDGGEAGVELEVE
jgi:hypothetical protein